MLRHLICERYYYFYLISFQVKVFPANDDDDQMSLWENSLMQGRKIQHAVQNESLTNDLYNSIKLPTYTIRITSFSLVEQRGIVTDKKEFYSPL